MPPRNEAALSFLLARRSRPAKLFTPPVPDRAGVEEIVRAALRVPDHGALEPWRIVALDRAGLARLADLGEARARETGGDAERIAKGRGQFDRSHLCLAVIAAPVDSPKVPEVEQILSAGALCLGLVNAAEAAGWGACWLTGWPAHDPVLAARAFGCTGAERIAGFVHIGTAPPDGPDRPRPALQARLQWEGAWA
jgi:nitroreductase